VLGTDVDAGTPADAYAKLLLLLRHSCNLLLLLRYV
jgi:hypothetical protein